MDDVLFLDAQDRITALRQRGQEGIEPLVGGGPSDSVTSLGDEPLAEPVEPDPQGVPGEVGGVLLRQGGKPRDVRVRSEGELDVVLEVPTRMAGDRLGVRGRHVLVPGRRFELDPRDVEPVRRQPPAQFGRLGQLARETAATPAADHRLGRRQAPVKDDMVEL